ncbi:LacI family DNA-binding transcriptional regulator [Rhodobacteraceae bacterium RKSG542]|uniref:LacI family DNA-binding transcriptional regulator n=1 Tax=Pseudovibrio flavus TaxID=2529854 RepID=UPI0012BC6478|nr:LacI family DNA-binding transcriptional regulator [Pseudovibrio flavus]MTI18031.1 LacI family DNA-binding transcriptional regulator [Pseudovibrio flavus]
MVRTVAKASLKKENNKPKTARRSRRRREGVTLQDVANLAGVSMITVSRAINTPDRVKPDTLEIVKAAIKKSGYVPNVLAGGLASSRTRMFAAIVPTISNMTFSKTMHSFSKSVRTAGYQVLFTESGFEIENEEELVYAILARRPDGLMLTGVNHSKEVRNMILSSGIPTVETGDLTQTPLDYVVGCSQYRLGEAVGQLFLKRGFTKVGLVTADNSRAKERAKGLLDTLAHHDNIQITEHTVGSPTTLRCGRDGLGSLIEKGFTEGAIFCTSDTVAHGVLVEAHARGIIIPDQMSVIGMGDEEWTPDTHPSLSTVRIDRDLIGEKAAEILLKRVEGEDAGDHVVDLGFEIVLRGSLV